MKRTITNLTAVFLLVVGLAWFSPQAFARDGADDDVSVDSSQITNTDSTTVAPVMFQKIDSRGKVDRPLTKVEAQELSAEKKKALIEEIKTQSEDRATNKLDEAKKKICENKSEGIKNAMEKIGNVGKKHGEWLGSVVDKVESFVTANSLTVENYETLLADVDNAKAAVDAAVQTMDTYKGQFDCSTDPKGVSEDFKTAFQVLRDAQKAYKQSVKSLLEAVKTAAKAAGIAPNVKNNSTNSTTGGTQ